MPLYDKHVTQAQHNEAILDFWVNQNKQTDFSDWFVTVGFYTALHYFEAMLNAVKPNISVAGFHTIIEGSDSLKMFYRDKSEHLIRKDLIKTNYMLLNSPYNALYKMSRAARYNCHEPQKHDWALSKKYLDDVKSKCLNLISKHGK